MIRFLPSPLRGLKLLFVLGIGLFALSFNPSPFGRDEPVAIGPYLSYQLPSVSPLVDWEVQTAFSGLSFDNPAFMIPDHMGETFFIGDREGKVYTIDNELSANEKQLVLDIENITAPVNDGGLLSMALHPEFGQQGSDKSRYVYLYYMGREPGAFVTGEFEGVGFPGLFHNAWMRLSRFTVKENSLEIDPDSELRMINIRMYNGSHRGGELLFGNDGYLYLSLGEQFRYQTAQDLSETLEGGILRIDVDMMPGRSHPPIRRFPLANTPDDEYTGIGYYIPNDNPFLSPDSELFEEYYTLGNRNPYRMAIDRETGQIWMGEVGDSKREEINRVVAGANYGWPYLEGTLVKNQLPDEYYGTLRGPDHEFSRAQAFAIIGGFVYRGSLYPELYGKYICGDFVKSSLWALEIDEEYQIIDEQFLCSFGPGNLVSFGQDPKGEIYLLRANNKFDFASSIYRLAPRTGVPDAPQWLSEVGVFKQLNPLKPEDFLLPYQPIEPFWSDGALKQRWMAIPNNGSHDQWAESIRFSSTDDWRFPKGSVFVKHFELPIPNQPGATRKVETRFIIVDQHGQNYGLTYRWEANGEDARLLTTGLEEEIELGDELQTWYYPTPADCGTCHNQAETGSLGANARQLNHDILYPTTGRVANQIQTLNHLSMFREKLTDEERLQVYNNVNSKDSSQALTLRVQSYLDANCAYCHRPNSGNRALFDATMNEDIYDQYLIDGDIINASLAGCTKLIRPGDVAQSIIHQRMNSLEEGVAMPPLAKNKIDEHGVALLEAWIKSLPVESSAQNSVDWENMFENNQFKQVSTGWDCSVWAIDQADQVWYFNEEQWERSDQQFSMIAAGTADDTYGLDLNGQIVHWDGQRWTRTIDQSVYNELSVGKDGSLWAIDWEGKLYERRGNEWIERAGGTLHIAVLDSQNAWRMAGDNNLIHWNGTEWRFVGYRYRQFRQIAYGDGEKLMAIDKGFDIYEYVDQSWRKAQGQFKQLSIGAGGVVWGISQQDSIYRGVSLEWTSLGREALELVKVSGDTLGQVWALDAQQKLWAFNSNNTWEESPFVFAQISSTANGQLWGLQPNGQVYQQTANSTWNEVETPVTFQQIYAGLGKDLWAIDSTQNLWRLSADLWQQEVGQLQDIAIGGSDRIFGIDLNGHIQHYSDGQWLLWDDAFNFSKLAVGKDIFWAITNEGFLYERKAACWVRRPETALDLSAWTNQQVYMADALGRINKWAPGNLDCSNTLEKESFAANGIGFEYTAISWTTYIDQLISSYEVQRSAINSNFETIHRQDALFGDRVKRDYAWNDQAPMEGDNYYRLAYLRSDGEIGYSPVVRVFYPKEDQTLLVYPNPFTSRIELNLQAFTGAAFELRIHDMAGRRLLLQEYPADHLGDIRLDLSNLASGIYLLQIWSPDLDKKISEKIIRH